eukprot:gnl/TRDRNA2_/TRDRNA2_197575_c0_seq1.p1 gnl/TRDRNA2_/TRDRNA2_197575_c0~~gnl/TRDRNA2_/TRDRNA2_197575_c0_seq1.p1  ORF type:complete len:284 (+),score=43.95 gnl/TRDRNA2_/TRDRNA2_197575_c0_seq1:54-905(+)
MGTSLDQLALGIGHLSRNLGQLLPESRPADPFTLAHVRAAERVQRAAAWVLREGDLEVVCQQTPFTAETAADLWQYYESLPLSRRPELLVLFLISVEVLGQMGDIFSRERCPRLRRVLDVYGVALGAACLAPRTVFYYIHRTYWQLESAAARRGCTEPQAPLALSAETMAAAGDFFERGMKMLGLNAVPAVVSPRAGGSVSGTSSGMRWTPLLLASSLGIGMAAFMLGEEGRRRAHSGAKEAWQLLRAYLQDLLRSVPQLPRPPPSTEEGGNPGPQQALPPPP